MPPSPRRISREEDHPQGAGGLARLLKALPRPGGKEAPGTGDRRCQGLGREGGVGSRAVDAFAPAQGDLRAADVRGEAGTAPGPRPAAEGRGYASRWPCWAPPEAVNEAAARITAAAAVEASTKGQLDLLTIRSPIDGILDKITCRLGQSLTMGTPIGEVVDPRQLYVLVWLPTRDVRLVQAGQSARVTLDDSTTARPTTGKAQSESFAGKVEFVGQVVDPQTGNVPVRVLVKNPEKRIRLGQMATVAITVLQRSNVLAVPAAAISNLGEGPLVSVVRDDNAVLKHPQTETGLKDHGWVELTYADGIEPGEPVIVEGNYNLPDGTPVKATPGDAKP